MQTRRAALLTIAGAAASPILSQQAPGGEHTGHAMADATPAIQSFDPIYFKPADYALVSRLADLILPKTDTPGALEAHVPFRIDHEVAASPELQSRFAVGLQLLPRDFATLSEPQQVAILTTMSEAAGDTPQAAFFQTMKSLTVDWYYRSEDGLVKELGFHGNTYRAEFPGCTHPEHWPAAEQETR